MWESYKKGYKAYLQLEKSLSDNSVEAYMRDIDKLTQFLQAAGALKKPAEIQSSDLKEFIRWVNELGMTASSQARVISGIRSFFKYCSTENIIKTDPSLLLEAPRLKRALPEILTFDEIENILGKNKKKLMQ